MCVCIWNDLVKCWMVWKWDFFLSPSLSLCYTLPMCQTNNMHNIIVYIEYCSQLIHNTIEMLKWIQALVLKCSCALEQNKHHASLFFVFQGRKKALKRIKPSTLCSRFCLYIWRYIFFLCDCVFDGAGIRIPSLSASLFLSRHFLFQFFFASEREDNRVIERKRANEQQSRRQIKYICMWLWL